MFDSSKSRISLGGALAALALLAGCATPAPPPPPPPPPPPAVVVIPPRPAPPAAAAMGLAIPLVGTDGVRQTVNAYITGNQTVWNLRSALNVAALNCTSPVYATMIDDYGTFLDTHKRPLAQANRTLQSEFRERYSSDWRDMLDSYMTRVYNFYALPPAQDGLCRTAQAILGEAALVDPATLDNFAAGALHRMDTPIEEFYQAYERYQVNVASWESRYGPPIQMPSALLASQSGYGPALSGPVSDGTQTAGTIQSIALPASTAEASPQPGFGATVQKLPGEQQGQQFPAQPYIQPMNPVMGRAEADSRPAITLPGEQPAFVSEPIVQQANPAMGQPETTARPILALPGEEPQPSDDGAQ